MIQPKTDFTLCVYASTVESEDYMETKTILEYEAGQSTSCVAIPILDDCVLEELESFKIEMGQDVEEEKLSMVRLDAGEGMVRITDEQSKCPQPLLPTPQYSKTSFSGHSE